MGGYVCHWTDMMIRDFSFRHASILAVLDFHYQCIALSTYLAL